MKSVGQCLTCSSPLRFDIEHAIMKGTPFSRIAEDVLLRDPSSRVTVNSMKTHFDRGHMPMESEVIRRTVERRARERGQHLDDAAENVASGVAFAEIVLHRAIEDVAEGRLSPSVADGLNAAKLIEQFAPVGASATESDYVQAFMIFHQVAQEIMSVEQFEVFGRRLEQNQQLQTLMSKYQEGRTMAPADDDDFYAVEG